MTQSVAFLFDLDGTLVDSYSALADAVNYALSQHGLDQLTMDEIRGYVGEGLERLLDRARPDGLTDACSWSSLRMDAFP